MGFAFSYLLCVLIIVHLVPSCSVIFLLDKIEILWPGLLSHRTSPEGEDLTAAWLCTDYL